jgi:hypothetical protein
MLMCWRTALRGANGSHQTSKSYKVVADDLRHLVGQVLLARATEHKVVPSKIDRAKSAGVTRNEKITAAG